MTFVSVTQNSREGTGNKSRISTWRVLNPDLTRAKNFRQLINKMRFVCVKEGEDYLMCNGTRYDLHEEALSYKDSTFWVYLGVYVGLVLLAGKEDVTLYFYNSVVLKLTTSAIVVGRSKNLKPNEPDGRNLRMLERII